MKAMLTAKTYALLRAFGVKIAKAGLRYEGTMLRATVDSSGKLGEAADASVFCRAERQILPVQTERRGRRQNYQNRRFDLLNRQNIARITGRIMNKSSKNGQ